MRRSRGAATPKSWPAVRPSTELEFVPADEFATRVDAEHADATLEHFGRAPLQSMDKARTALRYLPKQGATDTVPESIDAWVANRNCPSPPSTQRTSTHRRSGPHWAGRVGPHGRSAAVGTTPYGAEVQHHRDCPLLGEVQHRACAPWGGVRHLAEASSGRSKHCTIGTRVSRPPGCGRSTIAARTRIQPGCVWMRA